MTIKEMELNFEKLGYWVILLEENLYMLQNIATGVIEEELFNIEGLQNKLESLEEFDEPYEYMSFDCEIYCMSDNESFDLEDIAIDDDEPTLPF